MSPTLKAALPAVGLVVVCAAAALEASTFRIFFPADPLGPRAFPLLGASLMMFGAVALWRERNDRGHPNEPGAGRRIAGAVLALLCFSWLLGPAGFVMSTSLAFTALAVLFGGRPAMSAVVGTLLALALWGLFVGLMGLPLPVGTWFS